MDETELVPSNPQWPQRVEEEATQLPAFIPVDLLIDLEPIGSTAVPGLPPSAPRRTQHLHNMEDSSGGLKRLALRDYLRDHPEEARRYAALKQDLATRFRDDREAYTEAKGDFIEEVPDRMVTA